ncbi:MAG: hypothetical protein JKY57_01110 [Kordiimonadaceae bacterium]|nr:hypothetical protein [Kordiimonadaceae bacterium]
MRKLLPVIAALCSVSPSVIAEDFFSWHTENIQLLRGYTYQPNSLDKTIITLEHANRFKYGDFFIFADFIWPDGGDFTYYSEITPRLSLSKVSGHSFSVGPIKDVLLSATIEVPKSGTKRYLYGGAIDWNVPGFTFFKTLFYVRDNPTIPGTGFQTTIAWNWTVKLGKANLLLEGFADIASDEGDTYVANELYVPRFLLDTGDLIGLGPKKFFLGMELTHWRNRAGNADVTESAAQLQAKWVF